MWFCAEMMGVTILSFKNNQIDSFSDFFQEYFWKEEGNVVPYYEKPALKEVEEIEFYLKIIL